MVKTVKNSVNIKLMHFLENSTLTKSISRLAMLKNNIFFPKMKYFFYYLKSLRIESIIICFTIKNFLIKFNFVLTLYIIINV